MIAVLQSVYTNLLVEASCTSCSADSDVKNVLQSVTISIMAKARGMVSRRVGVILRAGFTEPCPAVRISRPG